MENKICSKCGLEKPSSEFRDKRNQCKPCELEINRQYKAKNKNKLKEYSIKYYNENLGKIKKRLKENKQVRDNYEKNNKEKINTYKQNWKTKNPDKYKETYKKYYKNNKVKIQQGKNIWRKQKLKTDICFKLKEKLRQIISESLRKQNYTKKSRTYEILGCTYEQFKLHLESQFESWMNWDNYGKYNGELNHGWDIDHIKPLASSTCENDIIRLNHYTNLRPLCSYVNRYIKKHHVINSK